MYEEIEKHGQQLNDIFKTKFDNITLCKRLFSLENKAHRATTCLCNTNTLNLLELNRFTGYDVKQATEEEQEVFFDKITRSLEKILGKEGAGHCFINHDPRGYALKIKDSWITEQYKKDNKFRIYTDFGGNGILAPEFNGKAA